MVFPCFFFFDNRDPADPFIASKGSETIPFFEQIFVSLQYILYIRGDSMYVVYPCFYSCHAMFEEINILYVGVRPHGKFIARRIDKMKPLSTRKRKDILGDSTTCLYDIRFAL